LHGQLPDSARYSQVAILSVTMSQVTRGEDVPTALSVRDEDVPTADLLPRRLSLSTVGTALDVKHIGDLSVKIVGRSSDDDGVIRYTIQLTGPDGWTILRRRYRDFEELHRQLLAGNPQAIAMPPKKYFRSIFSPKFQDEREQRLGEVAAACLESVAHEELDDCPPALRRFLGLMDVSSSFLSAPEKDASPSLPSALADLCLDGLWIHNGAPIARVAGSELHWLADGEIVSHLEPISGGVWSIEMDGEQFEAEASREGNELRLLWSDGEVWTHSNESAEAVKSHEKDQRLADIFNQLDRNGDGSVNKRELIKACANSKDIADLFCLPQRIRQEDGSREEFERIFQDIDANDDREIDWAEFKAAFAAHTESAEFAGAASAASPDVKSGPAPSALPQASEKSSEVSLREKACAALTEASANGRLVQVLESVRGPAAAPAAETQLVSIENKLTKSSDGWPTRQAPEDDVAESDEACSNVLRGTTEVCGRKFKVDAAFCEGCGNRRAEEGPASPSRMRSAKIDAPPPSDGQEDVGYQQEKLKAEVAAAKTSSDKFDVYLSKIQEALEQNSDEALVQPEEGKPSACCRAAPALCTAAAVVALAAASASSRRRNGL